VVPGLASHSLRRSAHRLDKLPPRSYGFAYGDSAKTGNAFIGTADFALSTPRSTTTTAASYEKFFFTWAFSAAAATIVAGAVAERVTFWCYAIYSFIMSGFVSGRFAAQAQRAA
jgi:ammonia channel protein AmtB